MIDEELSRMISDTIGEWATYFSNAGDIQRRIAELDVERAALEERAEEQATLCDKAAEELRGLVADLSDDDARAAYAIMAPYVGTALADKIVVGE